MRLFAGRLWVHGTAQQIPFLLKLVENPPQVDHRRRGQNYGSRAAPDRFPDQLPDPFKMKYER
jgi:hypothetical protein